MTESISEAEIQAALAAHRERNTLWKKFLSEKSVDLTEARPTEVRFSARNHPGAAVLARELYAKEFLVTVIARSSTSEEKDDWNVEAQALISPEDILTEGFTEGMVRLAAEHGARYDGWATEA